MSRTGNESNAVNRTLSQIERFWSRVDKSGGPDACWPYMGARESNGYGYPTWGEKGRHALGHRLAWQLTNGEIPPRRLVCHTCDNPPCCNPAHLFLGTGSSNALDKVAKGRHPKTAKQKMNPEKVRELRRLRDEGWTFEALGKRYGIMDNHAYYIYVRRCWANVA